MVDSGSISPLTNLVTFSFAGIIVGGIVVYLALTGRKTKK
jgi:hypothetical protein